MPRCLQTCAYLYVSYCCQLLSMKWRSIMQYLSVVLRIKLVCVHAISLSPTADQLHVIVHSLTVGEWRECDTHNPLNRFYSAPSISYTLKVNVLHTKISTNVWSPIAMSMCSIDGFRCMDKTFQMKQREYSFRFLGLHLFHGLQRVLKFLRVSPNYWCY